MFSGFAIEQIVIILLVAAVLVGPERLPQAAAWLGSTARSVKEYFSGAKDRMKEELGDDFTAEDWKQLDPRQYDPRRIIRDALLEDDRPAAPTATRPRTEVVPPRTAPLVAHTFTSDDLPPFDDEAT